MQSTYHKPVLVQEVLDYLAPQKGGVYVDATFGGGGHSRAILTAQPDCMIIACDWDAKAIEMNRVALETDFPGRISFVWGNFANLEHLLKKHGTGKVDGILVDFGTSQYQIKERAGFSFSAKTHLDMRMSPAHQKITAADILNKATESELITIFKEFGQEPHARKIARAICEVRQERRFFYTSDVTELVLKLVPYTVRGINPATRVFQALRIAVNKELDNIKSFLLQAPRLLKSGGRLVCISFHSLEDRLVKQFIKDHDQEFENLTPKVIVGTPEEIKANPSARSAKLRAARRL
ncbi:MAG: 16S rRNA (cytosine(1402)-N(4))-methyltransferase RsmH [Candidatus Babeliaceae bacterium]|jgi:16S rRNA (cytosine1402-N4)-methyltransferase